MNWCCRAKACWIAGAVAIAAAGCAPPAVHTTFLESVDLVAMTDTMSLNLGSDPDLTARAASATPWVVSIDRIANHTNQVIPDREKWLYVVRLRAQLAQTEFAKEHAIYWIVPPEQWAALSREAAGGAAEPPEQRMRPTHLLTGEFRALTTTSGQGRSDAYLCAYQLVSLADATIVWEGSWEVKRAISGRTYD